MVSEVLVASLIIGGMGGALGLGLSLASKVFHVEVDKRVAKVREVLPGANCGACGFVGCDAFAEAIVDGSAEVNACPVGGQSLTEKLAEIMGVEASSSPSVVARVLCNGRCSISLEKYNYTGMDDCASAAAIFGGHKACSYGCLGHGNCVRACPFNAISIVDGIARIIEERCVACGKCLAACPKDLIEFASKDKNYAVLCRSKDKGPITKKNCQVGCIGCRLCMKACPSDAITMDGFLAHIDTQKCTNCGECEKKCPTKAIRKIDSLITVYSD